MMTRDMLVSQLNCSDDRVRWHRRAGEAPDKVESVGPANSAFPQCLVCLRRGASKGEGLGNQFLGNIRNVGWRVSLWIHSWMSIDVPIRASDFLMSCRRHCACHSMFRWRRCCELSSSRLRIWRFGHIPRDLHWWDVASTFKERDEQILQRCTLIE